MWRGAWGMVEQGSACCTDICDLYSAQGMQQLSLVLDHLCIYKRFSWLRLIAHDFKKPSVGIKIFIVYHSVFVCTDSLNCWILWHNTLKEIWPVINSELISPYHCNVTEYFLERLVVVYPRAVNCKYE